MQRFFYKNIRNSSIINSFCVVLLLLYCANCLASKPIRIYKVQRDPAFDATTAINAYKRYYWHYPDSKESFITFADSYTAYFWSDYTNKDKINASWYQLYKNIKRNRNDYLISTFENKYCVYTDFKERLNLFFTDNTCEYCNSDIMRITDFMIHYSPCAFDNNNNVLWDKSESLDQLFKQIQKPIRKIQFSASNIEYSRTEIIMFKYNHHDGSIIFLCDLNDTDSAIFETVKEEILRLLNDYCSTHADVSKINMYVFIAIP